MIRCLVVDDEPLALDVITDYIQKIPELILISDTTNAIEGLGLVQRGEIDLVFLDVQMPELSGIQFLKIMNGQCDVILTTAYPEYALDGYDLNVVDYLLKPIAFERFKKAVQKVLNSISAVESPKNNLDFIFVKAEHKIHKIDLVDILYIEGLKDYISIYTSNNRIITLQNMKKMEETLPTSDFIRVHKSYIIALDKIKCIERGKITIQDKVIPIGDTFREDFFKRVESKRS